MLNLFLRHNLCTLWWATAFAFILFLPATAQVKQDSPLQLVPLGHTENTSNPHRRIQAVGDTLSLPFWDDFSGPYNNSQEFSTYYPDTNRWTTDSRNVRINEGTGINPPSVGVATFDGVDASGVPYSDNTIQGGLSDDVLTSKPINLAVVPAAERNTVYLSFFWQPMGNVEMPDLEDSIRLQFKIDSGEWVTQWSMAGGDSLPNDVFTQELIPVNDPSFFHNGFQFRFQVYNKQYASFDNWHIDYVYMNKNRGPADRNYNDRAFTSVPSSPFREYTAIPMEVFRTAPASFLDSSSVGFYRLNARQFQTVDYRTQIRNQVTGQVVQILDEGRETILNNIFRTTLYGSPLRVNALNLNQDSLLLTSEFILNSGDQAPIVSINGVDTTFSSLYSYRANDTVSATFALNNYFAYDDGEAESGLELNQNGAQLAYQYYTPVSQVLTAIDINFPNIIQNQSASTITLLVWDRLGNATDTAIVRTRNSGRIISTASYINELSSFALETPVSVSDTFYIGFQIENDSIPVIGFDKNTESASKIFYKLTDTWLQNENLSGSLLLRPKFARQSEITGIEQEATEVTPQLKVYPNPAHDQITINGQHSELYIYDITGKTVGHYTTKRQTQSQSYQIEHLKRGLYILRIRSGSDYQSFKIVLQ